MQSVVTDGEKDDRPHPHTEVLTAISSRGTHLSGKQHIKASNAYENNIARIWWAEKTGRGGRNLYRVGIRITVPPRHAQKKRNQTGYRGKALLYIRKRGEIVAKDGTARGGPRTGSGRKSKGLAEKLAEGNPGGRKLTVMELPDGAQLRGEDMPEPGEYLKAKQRQGGEFAAENIYRDTWNWLKERGCEKLVSKQLIEQYAMSVSRWIQCENAISEYGFLSKHPTTGAVSIGKNSTKHNEIMAEIQSKEYKNNFMYKNFLTGLDNTSFDEKRIKILKDTMLHIFMNVN